MLNKKILFLTSRLPYPPIGGDRLKNFWLLKILSKKHKVHLVSIVDSELPVEFSKWAEGLGITYKIFKKKKFEFYKNALNFIFNKLPIQVNYYYFKDIQEYIDSIYNDFDIIFATLIRTAQYVMFYDKPKILDMADSVALNYIKSNKSTKSIKWKIIYSLESNRLLKYEKLCIKRFDKTLFFNEEEKEFFKELQKTFWVPHGVNEELLKYEKKNAKYKNYVIFFGKMDYQPNIDAVLWFLENVLSQIDKNLIFCVVGAYPPYFLKNLEKRYKNVIVTGFIEDPYEIIKSSVCVVAPMQTGGGIQNKILESMALGTVNIVSTLAAKPIGAKKNVHLIIEDNPVQIAKIINDIYINQKKYEQMKIESKNYISTNFTWSIYEKKIIEVLKEVINC
jgi:glycosyltransferase involved in cell wall biosynthesis